MKPLEQLFAPDPANLGFVALDSATGRGRPVTLADQHARAAVLALPAHVPEDVRGYFDSARTLWVYGWLHYPFYTWAGLHAGICVEMALKQRAAADGLPGGAQRWTLERLLREAVVRDWVRAADFPLLPEVLARRREMAQVLRAVAAYEAERGGSEDGTGGELPVISVPAGGGDRDGADAPTAAELEEIMATRLGAYRQLRNAQAHASAHSYMLPHHGLGMLRMARSVIAQLFPATA